MLCVLDKAFILCTTAFPFFLRPELICGSFAVRQLQALLNCVSTNRFLGVSDIAAVRFSLPTQLLEPTPNLGTVSSALMLHTTHATTAAVGSVKLSEVDRDVPQNTGIT
jgi:hypothetical protein